MKVLVCVKRVPITGGKIVLTDDAQEIRTLHLGFTIRRTRSARSRRRCGSSRHGGGEVVVLTLGPAEAEEQLRDCMAIGADRGDPDQDGRDGVGPAGDRGRDRRRERGTKPST